MQLTDEQKREVSTWIADGAKLSEVQQRLAEKFDIRLTYMEARFLVDDLKLVPREQTPPAAAKAEGEEGEPATLVAEPSQPQPGVGSVHVTVDQIMRPGAMVSGKVTFSDGVKAEWYLDQTGRFGLVPPQPGYRPSAEDFVEFRVVLEQELAKQGL